MGKVIAGMTMSLDGFVNDSSGSVQNLNPDFDELHDVPSFQDMIKNTGAAIMGRHTYEMADPFMWANDDYEFQTPLFVLTHTPPEKYPKGNGKLSFTFVTDGIESAVAQAKQAAGGKDIQVIGASTIQQCLNAGLCDVLQIDLMPILLGMGLRLLENIDTDKIKLERIKVEETTPVRTSITFRVTNS
ncbi:MAG TPA: dihydrofolate reductase family protein [Candidatus Saccharimonadales bacterium]|nr:dihydrofolate reductase family protein [Candidatus Saccharimonadales bacterium]